MVDILKGPSITKHQNPKKLMIMLHGYGDNATNFIQIANLIDQDDLGDEICCIKCTRYNSRLSYGV